MAGPVRIVIVDDHPVVRDGLRGMLAGDRGLAVVGEAGSGDQAVRTVAALAPDVVLMDLRMPGGDGVDATARIVAAHPRVRVLVLTTYDTETDVLRAVEAGASGYLLKDTPARAAAGGAGHGRGPDGPGSGGGRPLGSPDPPDAGRGPQRPGAGGAGAGGTGRHQP